MSAAPRLPWLLATLDADPAGYAYASKHREREAYRWSVDTAIYLSADARGRGIGRRLYTELLEGVAGLQSLSMSGAAAVVVPKGVWHTVKVRAPSRMLHVTLGAGTATRPV